jgi:hypothetical protein
MKRRGFLAGILAAGVAPAIVHNPMKIWVPKQDLLLNQGWSWPAPMTPEMIQVQIVEKIRAMAYKLYEDSGYGEAASLLSGLVITSPTGIYATDENLRRYLEAA